MKEFKDRPKCKDGNSKGCWTCSSFNLGKSCLNREKVNALFAENVNQGGGGRRSRVCHVESIEFMFQ